LDLALEKVRIDVRASDRVDVEVVIDSRPAPPGQLDLDVELMFISAGGTRRERCTLDGGRTTARFHFIEAPESVVLDPEELLPDVRRQNNVFSAAQQPLAYAVDDQSSHLALAFSTAVADSRGLSLFTLARGGAARFVDWYALPQTVERVDWVGSDRFLFLQLGELARNALLDLQSGRLRPFSRSALPGPSHAAVLENAPIAVGRYRHLLYHLSSRRQVPFGNEYPTRLRWVRGVDEVLAGTAQGEAVVLDLHGNERIRLQVSATEIRDLAYTDLGYTFVTDSAGSSRLHLLQDEPSPTTVDVPGILQDYFLAPESGWFYLFSEVSSRDHRVFGWRPGSEKRTLYSGKTQPLYGLHTPRGVVLTEPTESQVTEKLWRLRFFPYPFDQDSLKRAATTIVLCDAAFLEPAPTLSSAGRYLYYIRPEEPRETWAVYRNRALYRFDFLTNREEILFPTG
jgi:hypothetical protein